MRWFTSDLHFGHVNIISYCDRPYANVDDMAIGIIDRINAVVEPDDELWLLGDLAMGKIDHTLAYVSMLNGDKRLIPGNHDRCWPGHPPKRRPEDWTPRYAEQGVNVGPAQTRIRVGDTDVLVCHFPYDGDHSSEVRYIDHRPRDTGKWLLHGHTHGLWRQRGRQIDVGIDAWGGYPVSEETLAMLINAGPQDRDRIAWRGNP